MFCTIRERKNKYKQTSYNILLCERKKVDGKVKSSDKFIVTLTEEQVKSGEYILMLNELDISDSERKIITNKLQRLSKQMIEESLGGAVERVEIKAEVCSQQNKKHIIYKVYVDGQCFLDVGDYFLESCGRDIILMSSQSILESNGVDYSLQKQCLEKIEDLHNYYEGYSKRVQESFERGREEGYRARQQENHRRSGEGSNNLDKGHLKKIFRAMSKEFHPDSGGSEEIMVTINALKEQLGM